ncbi:MAG TPA: ester cyclase [Methanocella sp.]|nr:ester cyclase [Methanocella sp.]
MESLENNKELIRAYIKSYETEDLENVAKFLHPSHVYYPPGGGKPLGLGERMADERFFFLAFSGIETTVEDQIAEGAGVASRISMRCAHTGDYQGIPPTNKRIAITYMSMALLRNGKILKEWAEFDLLNILNQLK